MVPLVFAGHAGAGTYVMNACSYYGNPAPAFGGTTNGVNWSTPNECNVGRSLEINQAQGSVLQNGRYAGWSASSPSPALAIVHAYTPANTVGVDCSLGVDGFTAAFGWSGGSLGIHSPGCSSGSLGFSGGINQDIPPSNYFGWAAFCASSSGCQSAAPGGRILGVQGVQLTIAENTGPSLAAVPSSNLWYAGGWVRGSWPVTVDASDPSGVCWLITAVDGKFVESWGDPGPDTSRFTQCHGSQLPGQLDTTGYANGQHTLAYGAYNAASVPSSVSKTISVDNAPVSLSLSGPTDAPSTAGTQYVHAAGSAGPSGVAAIVCSVDGGASQRFAGASADVPVSGIGPHQIGCYAQNGAVDPSGAPASSPTQNWSLTIREPTVSAISFTKVVDRLRCRRTHEGHGKKRIRVIRCRPRTAWRRQVTWKVVRRHHKLVRIRRIKETRVVLLPHEVRKTARRVAFGHGTTVSGWLGKTTGAALAGQPVRVLTAPDNGQHSFTQVAIATAAADGSWRAELPPGPSRLVLAVYDGSTTTEPAVSSPIKVTVPARIRILRIWPRHVRWGGTVHIVGYMAGGYLPPPPAGELVRLRIGIGSTRITYGVKIDVTGNGRFKTRYTFGLGQASIRRHYWFQLQALPQDDYPYSASDSRRAGVIVGG